MQGREFFTNIPNTQLNPEESEIVNKQENYLNAEIIFRNSFSISSLESLKEEHPDIYYTVVNTQLNRSVKYTNTKDEVQIESGVEIINRQALCFLILQRYTKVIDNRITYNHRPFEMLFLDGKDFAAYNIRDRDGNLGGDLVLNLMAKAIIESCGEIANKFRLNANQLTPARLGGDEFIILVGAALSENIVNEINGILKANFAKIQAEYIDGRGGVGVRGVEMKGGEVIRIKPPSFLNNPNDSKNASNKFKLDLFFYYIGQNMVYDNFGLEKVMNDLHSDCDYSKLNIEPPKIDYPDWCQSRKEKLLYLASKNPIYEKISNQAIAIDKARGGEFYTRKVFDFYYNLVLNPLYECEVLNFYSFIERLSDPDSNFTTVIVIDLKMLKEINNQLNEGRGNMYLKQGFEEIVEDSVSFIPSEAKMFGENRGKLMVAISNKFSNTDDEESELYERILTTLNQKLNDGINFQIGDRLINLFFGFSIIQLANIENLNSSNINELNSDDKLNEKINRMIILEKDYEKWEELADENAYFNLIQKMCESKVYLHKLQFLLLKKAYTIGYRADINIDKSVTLENLLDIHFTAPVGFRTYTDELPIPQRFYYRVKKLIDLCKVLQKKENSQDKLNKLSKIIVYFENCLEWMDTSKNIYGTDDSAEKN